MNSFGQLCVLMGTETRYTCDVEADLIIKPLIIKPWIITPLIVKTKSEGRALPLTPELLKSVINVLTKTSQT